MWIIDAALVRRIGTAFVENLERDLTVRELARVRRDNARPPYFDPDGPCASHDVCDANVRMSEAMAANGFPIEDLFDDGSARHDRYCDHWNAAWAWAKRERLTATKAGA